MADKYWAGQVCPSTGTYGQYHDIDNSYAGTAHDRRVEAGERFPPSLNNHHYEKK
ncbi:YjzC family protein [Hansschlegelia zhihuaiae]|uniref:YjzC family protein n=1 Tax=Hansschlegelia zhihuaiae TaxID=405005 RepID=A0A4Q0MQU6_9HYPH|nr:YjzC family protein [Hansschlegelia zhihuaiae]RXF75599.1 YjzC family protein [Hansschlegelia zhihuaiae]